VEENIYVDVVKFKVKI